MRRDETAEKMKINILENALYFYTKKNKKKYNTYSMWGCLEMFLCTGDSWRDEDPIKMCLYRL